MTKKKYKCGGKMKYPDGGFLNTIGNLAGGVLQATGNPLGIIGGSLLSTGVNAITANQEKKALEKEKQNLINKINMQNTMQSFSEANKMYAMGGSLDQDNNITQYNGLPHDFGGLPLTDNIEVEDNETRGTGNTEDYIFSDSLQPNPKKKKTFADISKDIEKKYKGYENDKIAMQSKDKDLSELMFEQEALKQNKFEEDFTTLVNNYPDQMMKMGGKIYKGVGGPIDPPDGGDKRYLTKEEYDAEVAKRQAAYDKSFNQFLSTQGTGQDLDNPQVRATLRSQYEQMYPLDLTDIAVKKLSPSGFDYTDKNWMPSSAAISKYKGLIDAGKVDEANQVVLGHFQKGKGGGQFRESTHGEAVKLGNVKPITVGDIGEVMQYAPEKVPDLEGILGNMKYGGYIKANGGPIDPPRKVEGIKDYTPEQLEYHRQVLRKLYKLDPESGISNYPQYSLQAIRNPQLFGQPEVRSNFTMDPQSVTWNPDEGNPVVAYISPNIPKSNSEYTNKPRVGITAQEFKSNPEFYKNVLGGSYGDVSQYVLGQSDVNVATPSQKLNREDVLNMVNTAMSENPSENITFATGGPINPNELNINQLQRQQGNAYGVYNQPFSLNPTKKVDQTIYADMGDMQIIPPGQQSYNPAFLTNEHVGLTPEELRKQQMGDNYIPSGNKVITSPTVLKNQVTGGAYNLNTTPISSKGITYFDPTATSEKYNALYKKNTGHGFSPKTAQTTMNNLGVDPNYSQALIDNPKLMQDYYNYIENYTEQSPENYKEIENLIKQRQPNFKLSEGIGDKDLYGQHHEWMLDPYLIQRFMGQRETINPINPLGPPSFDYNPEIDPQLLQSGNPPQISSNPPGIENNGEGNLRKFRPDLLASGLSALPSVGMGIGNLNLANNLDFQQIAPEIAEPDYVDPTRAIQEVRDQYAGAKDVIRQVSGGSGNLMSNLLGATAGQSKATAGIQSQYDNINAGISNQFEQFNVGNRQQANNINAQIANQEERLRTQLKQQGYENLAEGLAGGIGTYYNSKRYADQMNIAGGENFYYRTMGPSFNQTPVKVFRGNGYHYYEDPDTGEVTFLHSSNGKQVKDPKDIEKYTKDLNKTSNKK